MMPPETGSMVGINSVVIETCQMFQLKVRPGGKGQWTKCKLKWLTKGKTKGLLEETIWYLEVCLKNSVNEN